MGKSKHAEFGNSVADDDVRDHQSGLFMCSGKEREYRWSWDLKIMGSEIQENSRFQRTQKLVTEDREKIKWWKN